ncbi:P-loop containing nucleoside triphosphate hydrolase [Phytophthora cactorum]|nr:P-loop containing nucleoside triphosphate hydrolase [Phytophthora cactorum]
MSSFEDVELIAQWIRERITLPGYQPKAWTSADLATVKEFAESTGVPALFLTLQNDSLVVMTTAPRHFSSIMYFVKNGQTLVTPANIKDALQYGTVEKDAISSLLHLMNSYYLQRLQANKSWPESVQKEFTGQFFRFMSSLTETVSRGCGKTVLYLPPVNPDKFNYKDKDLVQQLESTVIHWTRQIKEVINNQDNAHDAEGAGPLEEIKFWEHRTQDLSGLPTRDCGILRAAKSSYLQPFETLSQIIKQGSTEANDNLRFLQKLSPVCEDIARAQPDEIPLLLPKLLNFIRLIWMYSRHYNTEDRITSLLRKVSNEIIIVCCKKISLPDVFDGNVEASIHHLEQRFNQFARKGKDGKREDLPTFGGNRGMDIVKSLRGIEAQFEGHVDRLRQLDYDILDVKNTSWHSDFNSFKNGMKDLEAMTQNVINGAFESVSTVAAGVDMIGSFHKIAQREAIKRCVEKRTIDIFGMFKANIASIRNLFEKNKQTPLLSPTEPQFAGAALWARSLLLRATDDLVRLQELVDPSNAAECDESQNAYDGLRLVINEYIQRKYHDWIEDLNTLGNSNMNSRLENPLMTKTGADPDAAPASVNLNTHNKDANALQNTEKTLIGRAKKGFLHCNFDRPLLNLFAEVHYWQYFNGEIQIPYMAHDICNQKEQLRVLREHVMLVVRDYNRILLDLSSTERRLFEDIIRKLDRRIQPGLQKLTWVSKGIVEWYVADCRKHCETTYKIVQEFQENKDIVMKNCKMISGLMHIFIERNTIYDDGVFEAKQAYQTISSTMTATYEHFASGPPEVQREWNRFVERSDKMLEDALRQSVKKSLQELSKAINGDAKTDPRPYNKVEFKPFMADLTQMVNTVAKEIFNVISVVPRLVASLPQHHGNNQANADNSTANGAPADGKSASKGGEEVRAPVTASGEPTGNPDEALSAVDTPEKVEAPPPVVNNFYQSIFNDEEILKKYLGYWDKYKLVWNQDKQAFIRRYAKANRPLQQFRADIERYREQQVSIQNEDLTNTINFIQIDTNFLKASLVEHTVQWIGKLTGLLNQTAHGELKELMNMMKDNTQKLQIKPLNLDHLSESIHLLQDIKEGMPGVVARFEPLQHKYDLLAEFDVQTTDEEQRDLANLKSNWETYEAMLVDANTMLQKCKVSMKQSLQDSVADLNNIMSELRTEAEATLPYSGEQQSKAAHQILAEFEKKMEATRSRQNALKKGLEIFGIEESKNDGFVQTEKELELLQQIWALTDEWGVVWASWKNKVFYEIEVETMESTAAQFFKKVVKYGKDMKNWAVWSSMKTKIEQFRQTLPLIQDLKSPALRARHWAQLKEEMGKTFDTESTSFTLERVFSLGFHLYAEFISTLSSNAGKELSIEQTLDAIEKRWATIDVDITEYKGVYYKIRSADDLFTALEDDQVQLSTMKASPFFGSFDTRILYWEKALSHLSDVIETLLGVQRCWIYLESIFMASEDIRKQLPLESQLFDEVNTAYCRVTEGMAKTKNALQLRRKQEKLDQIQKCLDQYLETKRMLFPRFYFLSNDDLLEILGHQKDPDQVQKHIKKCFEAIKTLNLIPPGARGNTTFEALGMNSPCGEQVMFASNVVVAGAGKKEKWIKDFQALNEVAKGEKKALKQLKKKWISYLNKLADMVRGQLSATDRRKVVAVITIEIHSRDVIDRLVKQNCKTALYFNKDLGESGICEVKQTVTSLQYSYEYQGNNGRLVITPLTDRCVLTMTTALHLNRGGNPLGPAGTGKTETSVGRMFAGLVQSGGWGCFDEFNRIEIEVLSVVAQQVLTIMQALTARSTQVMFLGSMMRVNFNMGIFITMNPGYAGRTELPDNLKALMRPCAMMVPDLALIAEVMLQAEGFRDAKVLAKKTTTLYGLMIQQLSKQDHYDFGLRSLKAVLNMAGTLKREDPNLQEENILLRALRDMNMPNLFGKTPLLETKLQVHPVIVFKTIQLYESQVTRHCNMIVGQTMAGKTTIWKTLMAAKTSLAKEGVPGYMPVRVQVLNPKSISLNEIYGVYDLSTFEWIDGILSAIFRNLAADEKAEEKWIMLDGPVDTLWIESMNSVMDDNKVLTLINGDRISMSPSMALMFEVQDLAVASPATVSRAGMVYMDVEDLGWHPFIQTWLATTIHIQEERDVLQTLFDKYMEKVLRFKTSEVTELIPVTTFNSVKSFCNLYNALATAENGVDLAACGDKFAVTVEKWFLFCMTWSVMAAANEEGRKKFDFFLRDIDSVYPPLKTAYDFFVEPTSREFKLWDEKLPPNFRIAPNTPFHKIMTMLTAGIHTLLVGETGVGKTTVIEREIEALSDAYNVLVMNFSSATSSATTQDMIENVMEKRSLNRFGPVGGRKLVTFIDDMNMPTKDLFGSQPPLELLRQWVDYSCWYDRKKQTLKYFIDMQFVAAMGPPGGGRSVISSRFQTQLKRIFETMLVPKLAEFDDEVKPLGVPLVSATIQLYQNVLEQFLPTPANCHYLFNLRDMARVIQGLLLSDKHTVASRDGMLRLWMHESLRVFSDRLTSYEDRQSFKRKLDDLLGVHFQTDWGRLLSSAPEQLKENGPLFTYIFSTTPGSDEGSARYAEVMDMKMLKSFVEEQLENHNAEPGFVPMNLVMFSDALMHILRIHRQLMTMRGNLLLSLTKLAAFMGGFKVFQIEVGKNYRSFEFHEDIKKLYTQVGLQQQKTVFLFSDTQIKNESFVEDLNNILSSGEIPGLFEKDEQAGILDGVRLRARAQGIRETKESLWNFFISEEVGMKFLEEKNVALEVQRPKIAAVFAVVHSSVMLASSQVLARMKRHNYVTPTNYLSLVTGYIRDTRDKLKNGLAKLEESRLQVEEMSKQLEQRKIVVAQKNKDCSDLLVVIVSERRVADEQRKQVEADSERIGKEEAETKKIADDAQKDLDEALPALQRAMQEVENLDKKAIAEVKVYTQPPEAVSMVMCAVMILFGLPPTWASAKTKMNDVSFLQQIKTFDKDSIRDKTVTALKKYTSKPTFNSDVVRKVSSAAGALCSWVLAMECYSGVFRVVAPKKEVLRKSQQALAVKQKDLQVAKEKLQEVTEKVEALKNQYDTSVSEKNALPFAAEQLVKGLAGERERWEASIADKNASLQNVVGDALVAAAFISYAGPFDTFYRGSLVDTWMNRFTFIDFLADPTDVRSWNAHGLPRDPLSTENGVITTRGKRWPLMIDPQGQANKWIKAMEGTRLEVVDPMMKDLLRKLENGIRFGSPVLMQDILEELDPSLEPVLTKSIIKVGNREVLRLGDKELDYNREFRFYLTTKLHNPHYTPEVSTKTTIVNFVVKEQGLEAQLLGIAVQLEEPALEEQKSDLVMRGSLLDDEQLVTTLNASKTTSEEVSMQLVISEETEKKIDAARMGYALSLDAYVALFQDSIVKSRSLKNQGALSEELTERINAINDYHTYAVYAYACRGLFERHKLLFSLQMCARVLQSVNKLPHDEYDFLLKGGNVLAQEEKVANVANEFLSDGSWASIVELNKLSAFHGIISSFEQMLKGWKSWYQSSTPEIEALPGDWEGKCNELQRMLLLRCVRPDRLSIQAARFTATHLGAQFVDPPPFDLKAIYDTSNYKTPLIFVLSPGVDPTNSLIALAESLHKTVENCALGKAMLARGLDAGNWVFLANCHLMLSWAPTLEKLIDNFCAAAPAPAGPINPQFRCGSQRGIKMTTEPPRGLKANLIRLYNTITPDKFARCRQVKKYKRLLFCLCWFHSLLLERRKFNNLGWNIPYDFNESDFAISEDVLAIYLDEYEDTPWDALKYLIAQANYGGRVTDDWDRRLMLVYISQFFSENVLSVDNMLLSDSEYYFYIRQLPLDDPPAAFGQHPNAQIASQIDDGRELLATILSLQALDVAEGGSGNDDTVLGLLQTLRETVPDVFDLANIKAGLSARSDPDALKTVLMQELERYNKLLATINSSARALEKGIQGSVVITQNSKLYLKLRCEQMDRWANQAQPAVFWLTGFTYPTGFLTALLQTAARKNGLAIDSLNWEFIVLNQGENALPTGPKDGAYIKGLILEGARWDFDHDCLAEPHPMELHCGMPILHFRPVEAKKKSAKGLYSCPLYMYPLRTGTRERPSFMIAVDLKVGPGKTPDLWTRRGTALLLSLST